MKDDKYWCRRNKNNVAAKRSREARRVKENQITLRASYLERENEKLVGKHVNVIVLTLMKTISVRVHDLYVCTYMCIS